MSMDWEDVCVVHFSGTCSPAQWLLDPQFDDVLFPEFVEKEMLGRYVKILEREHPSDAKQAVRDRLWLITDVASKEWLGYYEDLAREFPRIGRLVDHERDC